MAEICAKQEGQINNLIGIYHRKILLGGILFYQKWMLVYGSEKKHLTKNWASREACSLYSGREQFECRSETQVFWLLFSSVL